MTKLLTNLFMGLVLLVFAGIYLASAVCWAFVDCTRRVAS